MSIQELTHDDFRLNNQKMLTVNRPGSTLVFFKMDGCAGCKQFDPLFRELPMRTQKINNYSTINVSVYRDVISMSRKSSTSIQTVPLIILYFGGIPYAKYTGTKTLPNLLSFIDKSIEAKSASQSFVHQPPSQTYGREPYNQQEHKPQGRQIGGEQRYASIGNDVEDEDEDRLKIPGDVIPHNVPWEGGYRKMGPD